MHELKTTDVRVRSLNGEFSQYDYYYQVKNSFSKETVLICYYQSNLRLEIGKKEEKRKTRKILPVLKVL